MGLLSFFLFIICIIVVLGFVFFTMVAGTIFNTWFSLKRWFNGDNPETSQSSSRRSRNDRNDTSTKQNAEHDGKIFGKDEGEYVDFEEIK